MAGAKPTPLRLPLGTDGMKVMMDKCQTTLKICREREAFTKSTDVTPNDGKWCGRATAVANLVAVFVVTLKRTDLTAILSI
jgi:hypothetical protein